MTVLESSVTCIAVHWNAKAVALANGYFTVMDVSCKLVLRENDDSNIK